MNLYLILACKMNKNLKIYKSNEIIESSYELTMMEQRVLLSCIAQIDTKKQLSASDSFKLNAVEFATIFGVSSDRAYSELITVVKRLANRWIYIANPQVDVTKLAIRWISSIGYSDGLGVLTLKFSQDIIPYLCVLKEKFTSYNLGNVTGMTSIFGIRLYELLTQYKQFGKRKFELDELKNILGITPDTYKDVRDFKKAVILPAVKNVNKCSDLKITDVTYQKTGRVISHVLFFFESNKTKVTVEKKSTKVKVEEPDIKNTQSSLDDIYNENVQRFGKAKADEIKVASEKMNISAVKKQLEKIAETKI